MATPYAIDRGPVDCWSIVHLGAGLAAGALGAPMLLTLAAGLIWEGVENWKRPAETVPGFRPESDVNAVIDIVAMLGGWGIGAALSSRRP